MLQQLHARFGVFGQDGDKHLTLEDHAMAGGGRNDCGRTALHDVQHANLAKELVLQASQELTAGCELHCPRDERKHLLAGCITLLNNGLAWPVPARAGVHGQLGNEVVHGPIIREEAYSLQGFALRGLLLQVDVIVLRIHKLAQLHELGLHVPLEPALLPGVLLKDGVERCTKDESHVTSLDGPDGRRASVVYVQQGRLSHDGTIAQLADVASAGGDFNHTLEEHEHRVAAGAFLQQVSIRRVLLPRTRNDEVPDKVFMAIFEDTTF
mmetsp:Transcript_34223/g.79595  ORF Transcript_34223/g.79595 Transcript_34223/m.79595 type:complete len:267 (+) Transcript_34223:964-1764(+)